MPRCKSCGLPLLVALCIVLLVMGRSWLEGIPPWRWFLWERHGCSPSAYLHIYPDLQEAFDIRFPFKGADKPEIQSALKRHYERFGFLESRHCALTEKKCAEHCKKTSCVINGVHLEYAIPGVLLTQVRTRLCQKALASYAGSRIGAVASRAFSWQHRPRNASYEFVQCVYRVQGWDMAMRTLSH